MTYRCASCGFSLDEEAFMDLNPDSDKNICNGCHEMAEGTGICSCGYRWQEKDIDHYEGIIGPCPSCGECENIEPIRDEEGYEFEDDAFEDEEE